jgi:5-(carboxyamino)imidazole ribonucleotide synthase
VPKKIGILGSGQLSQMMIQASRKLDVSLRVLASSENDSAAQEKGIELVIGKVSDPKTLHQFLSGLDAVGFESELIDISLLKKAVDENADLAQTRFLPALPVMALLSEKLEQKKLLARLGIPTSLFEIAPQQDFKPWLTDLRKRWGAFVLKWSKFGYDGRGVIVVEENANLADAEKALIAAHSKMTAVYAEPKVRFKRELALIAVKSIVKSKSEFKSYPLVISEQKGGACHIVTGPAVTLGVNPNFEKKAQDYAQKLSSETGLEGPFAIEMFETDQGELWVNEIAPRVHNSGHFTQDACAHDQFEMHVRVLMSESLPELKCTPSFAMLNLLGPENMKGQFKSLGGRLPKPEADLKLHWYGKDKLFPGRKLGHVNSASGKLELLKAYERSWTEFLKGLKS